MPPLPRDRVEEIYRLIQRRHLRDLTAEQVSGVFAQLYEASLTALEPFPRTELTTAIADKQYFAFEGPTKISRAINSALYRPDVDEWRELVDAIREGDLADHTAESITRAIYSLAMSFCAGIDLTRRGDQKTPGTLLEWLVAHLFAIRLGANPTKRLPVLNLDMETTLPTDYIFDLGAGRPKFHLPVKASTRERAIQMWAHQRVLDGVYGTGRFLGTPVILAETKTGQARRYVEEICLPDQWRLYQMHIAQLRRVYYLDVPAAYSRLNDLFPPLHVVPFGRFFLEIDELSA